MVFIGNHDHKKYITLDDPTVIERFNRITKGLESKEEKAYACFEWIQKNIRFKPERKHEDVWLYPAETIKLKNGDCEDHAFLLTTFLRLAGISCYFARYYVPNRIHAFVAVHIGDLLTNRYFWQYWDTTDTLDAFPPALQFEKINEDGILGLQLIQNLIPIPIPPFLKQHTP